MHPVLFEIPLPHWVIPLGPSLTVLAVAGVALALFGRRQRALDLLIIGVAVALAALIGALALRGRSYALEGLPVYSYGAMLCASLVAGWFVTLGLGQRDGMPRELLANCFLAAALSALVGARLLYVLTNLGEFHSLSDVLALRRGGLVAYGGFLGGFVGSAWYLQRRGFPLLGWADAAVPSLASGLFLTRIGCYLFGCDFGKPLAAGAPGWLRRLGTFPRWPESTLDGAGSPAWLQHVAERGLSPSANSSLPVHPTELYESLVGLLLFGLLLWVYSQRRFRGQVFFTFTLGYGVARFALEVVRDDAERGTFGPVLAERWYVPAAFLLFAAAFALGPAQSLRRSAPRYLSMGAALLPAALAWLLLRGADDRVALSTSQWISLLTSLGVAAWWRWLERTRGSEAESGLELAPAGDAGAALGRPLLGPPAPRSKRRRRSRRKPRG